VLVVEQLKPKRHNRDGFMCGEHTLDVYLRQQAAQHHRDGISTTHVLVDDTKPVCILGYYSLSAAQLLLTDLQEADRKHLPNYPVPAIRMGRLAVSANEQGNGHGDYLLAHAVARCLGLREQLGVRVLLVDALHEKAARFYHAYGFREGAANSHTL
jgi:GNAT superfamily N-acetyltransferase